VWINDSTKLHLSRVRSSGVLLVTVDNNVLSNLLGISQPNQVKSRLTIMLKKGMQFKEIIRLLSKESIFTKETNRISRNEKCD
jgi:hypothetical protein